MEIRNEIMEKLKEKEVSEKIVEAKDAAEVMKIFEVAGRAITEAEANSVIKARENLFNVVSEMSSDELEACSGGKGLVGRLSDKLSTASAGENGQDPDGKFKKFVHGHSDALAEGILGTGLGAVAGLAGIGAGIAGTLGISAIVKKIKNRKQKS